MPSAENRGGRGSNPHARPSSRRRPSPPGRGGAARSKDYRARARPPVAGADEGAERSASQQVYDGPTLPDDVTGAELSTPVRRQLSSLPDRLAERVARHLVMAGRLLQEEPGTAHQHAQAARARAGRLAVVREACGETAYFSGRFAEALADLRAARRMNGSPAYLPMMADCERALGRPERAIALSRDAAVARLDDAGRAEMTIVVAGARRDRGETAAALTTLAAAPLHSRSRAPWVARLRYAYADALLEAGQFDDAVEWFHRTVAADVDAATDAAERLAALSGGGDPDSI